MLINSKYSVTLSTLMRSRSSSIRKLFTVKRGKDAESTISTPMAISKTCWRSRTANDRVGEAQQAVRRTTRRGSIEHEDSSWRNLRLAWPQWRGEKHHHRDDPRTGLAHVRISQSLRARSFTAP